MSEPTVDPRAVTPVFGWHVPALGDVPNIPADLTTLATDIENTVKRNGHGVAALPAAVNTAPAGDYLIPLTAGTLLGGVTFATSGLRVPIAGRWMIAAVLSRTAPGAYYNSMDVYINGVWGGVPGSAFAVAAASGYTNWTLAFPKVLAANDLITLHANCGTANITIATAHLSVSYIGPA